MRGRGHARAAANVREERACGSGRHSFGDARRRGDRGRRPCRQRRGWSHFPCFAAHGRRWAACAESAIPPVSRANHPESASTWPRSEEHTSELQSHLNLVCRLLLEKKKYI